MSALKQIPKAEPFVHRWRAFAVLAVAFFMAIVDLTIVNVLCLRSAASSTSARRTCNGSSPRRRTAGPAHRRSLCSPPPVRSSSAFWFVTRSSPNASPRTKSPTLEPFVEVSSGLFPASS